MSKTLIGLLFILAGFIYGSLVFDNIYNATLGWLEKNEWIKPPITAKDELKETLGRKPTILLYSLILILVGLFILWKQ